MNLWVRLFCLVTGVPLFGITEEISTEQRQIQAWAQTTLVGEASTSPMTPGLSTVRLPFSFTYGGESSTQFLAAWKKGAKQVRREEGREIISVTYTDPRTGLQIDVESRLLPDFPAVEWVLHFRNTGSVDTPLIENVRALDLSLTVPAKGEVILHHSLGSRALASDFLPISEKIEEDGSLNQLSPAFAPNVTLASNGGRSSDGALPFFNLQLANGGMVGAIGWSGQWEMQVHRAKPEQLTLEAGQPDIHLKLHPGESIRTPRILLLSWSGADPMQGFNLFRRMVAQHYQPQHAGQIALTPVSWPAYFAFDKGNGVTETNQVDWISRIRDAGAEAFWLDAGWFEGGWPHGVGNLTPDPKRFPRGLAPVGEAAHRANLKFILWFEPERIDPASRIAREHPGWVLHSDPLKRTFHVFNPGDGLFNLGDPAARSWLARQILQALEAGNVDTFRMDFNIEPLEFWRAADRPDRRGVTEIRYVEGLYALLDELVRQRPTLTIDNCASGGRRIDLEMLSRSYVLWRSDRNGRESLAQQVQVGGLSLYLPQHASGVYAVDPYSVRSAAITGVTLCPNLTEPDFPIATARQAIQEVKELRSYAFGDYYPLFPVDTSEQSWAGWQFDRPENGDGIAVVLRRTDSPYASAALPLRGIDRAAQYDIEMRAGYATKPTRVITGEALARLLVTIEAAPGSLLIKYHQRPAP